MILSRGGVSVDFTRPSFNRQNKNKMNVKELKEALAAYPDDMEVVVDRMEYDDTEHIYDAEFYLGTNDNNQLVID